MFTKKNTLINNWLLVPELSSITHHHTGETRRLGEYQYLLLSAFVQNPGKIFTREELIGIIWKNRCIGSNSLPNAVHAVRTALGDCGKNQNIIKTIPRKGYFLDEAYLREVDLTETSCISESDLLCVDTYTASPVAQVMSHLQQMKFSISFLPSWGINLMILFTIAIISAGSTIYTQQRYHAPTSAVCPAESKQLNDRILFLNTQNKIVR